MSEEKINILCSTDDAYVPWCGIMLTSVLENNRAVEVYVLTGGLNNDNIDKFGELSARYGCPIHIIKVDEGMMAGCPIREGDHVSKAAYLRLMAPKFLPEDVHKVIYLDCDMIVNGSLLPLWQTDMDGKAIGCVIDEAYHLPEKYTNLGITDDTKYFNSGMLVMNLDYWRENGVMERCFECIAENPDRLKFHDQDTLNIVLQHEHVLLPLTYNFQTGFLYSDYHYETEIEREVMETAKAPVVIHYTGSKKPWIEGANSPYVPYFKHYMATSIWSDTPLIAGRKAPLSLRLRYKIYELVWALVLKPRPHIYKIETQQYRR